MASLDKGAKEAKHGKSEGQNVYPNTLPLSLQEKNVLNNQGEEGSPSPTEEEKQLEKKFYKIISDLIHGHIQLDSILIKIIDTPQFQRLRDIKQLGCTYRVFPGASHNRFEHAIGVCYVAGELVEAIMNLQRDTHTGDEPIITRVDACCVKIAALCYNLGYGPFSHVFRELCSEKSIAWNLEKISVVMFHHLIKENNLKQELKKVDIRESEIEFIEALIDPSVKLHGERIKKSFLRKIVCDPETNIDAVTIDSIARDSYLLNIRSSFDHKRLVKFVRLNKLPDSDSYTLCYREIEAQDLYTMFLSRLSLQTKAYNHKTVQLLEWMLKEALMEADGTLQLTKIASDLLSEDGNIRTEAAKKYTLLTDCVMDRINNSTDESLIASRMKWLAFQKREVRKFIGTVTVESVAPGNEEQDSELQLETLKQLRSNALETPDIRDCIMLIVEHRFGTKKWPNPVEHVYFYPKTNLSRLKTIKIKEVSKILPNVFVEVVLRVYHHDKSCAENITRGFKALINKKYNGILKWTGVFPQNGSLLGTPDTPGSPASSPMVESGLVAGNGPTECEPSETTHEPSHR